MRLVRNAKKSILMTMQAKEEAENPLPNAYFSLIRKKMEEGVQVIRVGFGLRHDFENMSDRVFIDEQNYTFVTTKALDYRRMLLVDGSKLMFVKMENGTRYVYYTDDVNVVNIYKHYFNRYTLL